MLVQPAAAAEWNDPALASIIEAQRKRVMGRMRTYEHVERVATTLRPAIEAALRDPSNQVTLQALAQSAGMSVEQYREYFAGKQEADLLLESGGDPNARSVSDAIGVAQFMVGTGQRCGLKIDLRASNRLSRKIAELDEAIEWLAMQPEDFVRPLPKGSHAPGTPYTKEQWLDLRRTQRESLVAKRRIVDERFDPAKSVRVQTRYLLRLTRRYGGVDWALQAYHGGEGGVSRTVGLYARSHGPYQLASRGAGSRSNMPAYSDLYKRVTPTAAPAAFAYLYGRSDDHRNYWWKVLMAEQALTLYHRDPEEFKRQWQSLKPGYSTDVVYYPEPEPLQFQDGASLRAAHRSGEIVPLPPTAPTLGLKTDVATLDPASAPLLKGLRPEAMGALLKLARLYRSHGGKDALVLTGMARTAGYQALWDAKYPRKPLPADVPRDPEYHTTGLVFDIKRPQRDWDRKVLEYALGALHDSLRIAWRKEGGRDGGPARYHVTPNPRFKSEFMSEVPSPRRVTKR